MLMLMLWLSMSADARAQSGQDYANQVGEKLVGRQVPPLRLTAMDGMVVDLGELRGRKAVYLKFWATWCVPCREQMPHFENVQRNAGSDLAVVAVNIGFDDTPAQIAAYRHEHGLTMPIVRDDDGRLGQIFGLRVTPQHVVIGKDGRIAYVGHLADSALDRALVAARRAAVSPVSGEPSASIATAEVRRVGEGDEVPAVAMKTLEGIAVPLADPQRKRTTVLAFLSPWCESYFAKTRPQSSKQCIALREQLVAHGRNPEVRWIGIASGLWASEKDLRDYRNEHRIPVPLALDHDDALFRRFGIRKVPAVVLVGAGGRVERRIEPDASGSFGLQQLLAEPVATAEPLPVEAAFAMSSHLEKDGTVAIDWSMPPGYYLYRNRFKLVAINAPNAIGSLQWSPGKRHKDPQFGEVTVFYDRAQLRVPLRQAGLPPRLELDVTYQGCQEGSACYPPTTRRVSLEVPPSLQQANGTWLQWLVALAAAFAGGLVLNLMPCVLPVLSLKVLSVLEARGDAIGAKRRAWAYTAGVLLSFVVLGLVVLAIRASGAAVDWGVQMQQPWIVALLVLVMLAVGLSLSGVIHLGAGLAGLGARQAADSGLRGDFLTGVLACVVASPCTAPFMGSALAFAFAAPGAHLALPVFLALGLGVAFPFLLIAYVPAMARWLPRPGAWMETLKQLLAFPMYGTAIWLLWVLGKQRGVDAMALALLGALVLALGLWLYERHRFSTLRQRVIAIAIMAISLAPLSLLAADPADPISEGGPALPAGAERFSPARLEQLRRKGVPVFVDVTADWCLTCKANEAAVLDRSEFRALIAETGTVHLVADYTRPDPAIADLLKEHKAVGIPVYLVYGSDGRVIRLPSVLTLPVLMRELNPRAGGRPV